ncbi:hypothetical protein DMI70_09620 [Escherichia coli]|nr:hypothetical protein [Escherichia coli]
MQALRLLGMGVSMSVENDISSACFVKNDNHLRNAVNRFVIADSYRSVSAATLVRLPVQRRIASTACNQCRACE